MTLPIRIALVGLGKISVDQHLPAIAGDRSFELAGGVSPRSRVEGIPAFPDLASLVAETEVDAVAVNTPPQIRFAIAREALLAGKHVLLEKPPCATVSELRALERLAREQSVTLYAGWHSQHAPGVGPARAWLSGKRVRRVDMRWCENVRQWHPGQQWIWEPGGLGVFDPGINALSILTQILPEKLVLHSAELDMPANCFTPIAARLAGSIGGQGQFSAVLDFLQTGLQTWSIDIVTDHGDLSLALGGAELVIAGSPQAVGPSREYPSIYRKFAELVRLRQSEIDAEPLALVADAFLVGRQLRVEDFIE